MVEEEGSDGPDEDDGEGKADGGACAFTECMGEGPGVALGEEPQVYGG